MGGAGTRICPVAFQIRGGEMLCIDLQDSLPAPVVLVCDPPSQRRVFRGGCSLRRSVKTNQISALVHGCSKLTVATQKSKIVRLGGRAWSGIVKRTPWLGRYQQWLHGDKVKLANEQRR